MAALAHAADRTHDFVLVDNLTLTDRNDNPLPSPVPRGQEFKLKYEFSIPNDLNPELSAGDTYLLNFPIEVPLMKQAPKPLKMGDVQLATWEILDGNRIRLVFSEHAGQLSNRGGEFWVESGFNTSTIGTGGETTLDFDVGKDTYKPITVIFEPTPAKPDVEKIGRYLPDTNEIMWTIRVHPAGKPMSNFVIRDMIPEHTAFVPGSERYNGGNPPTWMTTSLSGRLLEMRLNNTLSASFSVAFRTKVLPSAFEGLGPTDVKWIENEAIVGFNNGSVTTNTARESVSVSYAHKAAAHDPVGKVITWTVVLNPQGYDLKNVTFQDTLPAGTTYIDGSMSPAPPASFKVDGQTLSFTLAELNAPLKITYKTKVNDELYLGGEHKLTNKVNIGQEGGPPGNTEATAGVTVSGTGNIKKKGPTYNASIIYPEGGTDSDTGAAWSYDPATGTISWVVVVNESNLTLVNPIITDTLADDYHDLVPDSVAVQGLETTTYTITEAGTRGFTVSVEGTVNKKFTITLQTKLRESKYFEGNHRPGNITSPLWPKNTVTLKVGDVTQSAEAGAYVRSSVLEKTAQSFDYANKEMPYELKVNRNKNDLKEVVITEKMDRPIVFKEGSLMVGKDLIPIGTPGQSTYPYYVYAQEPASSAYSGVLTIYLGDIKTEQTLKLVGKIDMDDPKAMEFFLKPGDKTLINRATLTHSRLPPGALEVKTETTIRTTVVQKSGTAPDNGPYIDWTVTINRAQLTMDGFTMRDTLVAGLELDTDSISLRKATVSSAGVVTPDVDEVPMSAYTVAYDRNTREFKLTLLSTNKPGNDAYQLRFRTYVVSGIMGAYANSATLNFDIHTAKSNTATATTQWQDSGGSAWGELGTLALTKTEQGKPSHLLQGAKFGLYDRYNLLVTELETGVDGKATFESLRFDVLYTLKEIQPPGGFEADEREYPVLLAPGDEDNVFEVAVENARTGGYRDVVATKVWTGWAQGTEPTAYLRLMWNLPGEEPAWVPESMLDENDTLVKTPQKHADGTWTATWTNLPVNDLTGKVYTYTVREVDRDGNLFEPTAETDGYTKTEAGLQVTNELSGKPVRISKTAVNGTAELPGATLRVYEGETQDKLVEEWVSGNTVKTIDLLPGVYTLVETTAPQGYEIAESITFRVNLDGTVDIKDGTEWVPAQNATVHMEDAFSEQGVKISKTAVNGTAELPGATLRVYEGETQDQLVEEWVSGDTVKTINLLPGVYTLVETTAPQGYEIAESITFRVNLDGTVDIKDGNEWVSAENATVRMEDAFSEQGVKISKTAVNGTAELPGATLRVYEGEAQDTLVEEWVSGDTVKTIDLLPGVYTLVETTAPQGYEIAESITFRVNPDGTVDIKDGTEWVPAANATVHIEDAFSEQGVKISKTAVNGTAELPGATLRVYEGETQETLVEEWVSTSTVKTINLLPGVYTLVETTAPQGYEVAESITFRVNLDGTVEIKEGTEWVPAQNATVHMEDAFSEQGVKISKTAVNGTAELPGATLRVYEGETRDKLIEEWVSTSTVKTINLLPGVYTLVETTAPQGYEIAESITFRVNLDGTVDIKEGTEWVPAQNATVHMEDAFSEQGVKFSKTAVNGTAELPGATLRVYEGEARDKLVEEWVSTSTVKTINLLPGVYTLVETTAPQGYEIAESITFRVNPDGTVEIKEGTEWVPAQNATVHMEDAFSEQGVKISKTAVNGTAELPGATLRVYEGETRDKLIEEWVSTSTVKTSNLIPGVYTLVETTAPQGYEIAESITFRVNLDGTIDIKQGGGWVKAANATVRMQDALTPKPVVPTPSYATLRVPLTARKTLQNGSLRTETFTFVLKDGAGRVIAEAHNDQNGLITFPDRTFSRVVSNYMYTIEEKQGTTADITYDPTVFTVKVTTRAVAGKLVAQVDILKDGVPYAGDIHFVNTRKLPPTGDSTMHTIMTLFALSCLLLAGGALMHRRAAEGKRNRG